MRSGHSVRGFVLGHCRPTPINPHKIVHGQLYINGSVTHPSHILRFTDNQYICVSCGFIAQHKIQNLKYMCRRPVPEARTAHAKAMLKRHAEGLNEDPRQTRTRVGSGAVNLGEDRLQDADVIVISRVEQQVNEII